MVRINDQDPPDPPFNSGTVLVFDSGGEGRYIRISNQVEATALAEAAQFVADHWHAD